MVKCNIDELNQVFLNLIVNAAHAIHDSGKDAISGNISISTEVVNNFVAIVIADNGCGIPEAHLDKIYDPFFTTKEVGRGTGQGLAIARSIVVEKHGGDIRVNSNVGSGTQFTLWLPINGNTGDLKEATT
jgi:signal transduction histidine kinase